MNNDRKTWTAAELDLADRIIRNGGTFDMLHAAMGETRTRSAVRKKFNDLRDAMINQRSAAVERDRPISLMPVPAFMVAAE